MLTYPDKQKGSTDPGTISLTMTIFKVADLGSNPCSPTRLPVSVSGMFTGCSKTGYMTVHSFVDQR